MSRWHVIGLVLIAGAATGCEGRVKIVPVSGKVTLNGRPLPNASVEFLPIVDGVTMVAPGSAAETGPDGVYSLFVVGTGEPGAAVGRHQVTVYVREGGPPAQTGESPVIVHEKKSVVPARYSNPETLSFEVPPEGSIQADFALVSP
jgi:hypothetical protein